MTATPFILLDDSLTATAPAAAGRTLLFERPERVIAVYHSSEVEAGLDAISEGLTRGLHAAGFFAYELGYCLEPKLAGLLPGDRRQPLFWIGLFREPVRFADAETRGWLDANGFWIGPPGVDELLAHAALLFGGRDLAQAWMQEPALGLNGQRPADLAETSHVAEQVSVFLSRLERGVFV